MTETKTTKTIKTEDREDIFIPRGSSREDPNLFVSVNGRNFLLPKGKTSNVPSYVAEEIRRSWAAEEARYRKSEEMIEQGKAPVYKI
jgi:hypothetical protein